MAEDVVQDAAITAIRRLGDFEEGTNFLAWMSKIVRFTALNRLKHAKIRKARSLSAHDEEERGIEVADPRPALPGETVVGSDGILSPDQQEFDDQVLAALDALDPDRRACLLLRTVHGMTYEEISQALDLPEGTVSSHVHRAKTEIRHRLAEEDSDSPTPSGESPQ